MVVRPAAILLLACAASLLVACGGDSVFAPGDAVAQLAVPEPTVVAQSDSEIAITWSAVSGATHYKLYRSETSGGMYIQIGGEISVTRYLNDGLSANTSYYYQLEACSGDECSGRSPEVSATTAPPPPLTPPPPVLTPPAPAAPTPTAQSDSEIAITWSAVSGATHYKLYRSTTSGDSYSQIGGNIAATGYRDSGLSVKTAYYYQLEACNSGGCSGRSPEVSTETSGSLGAARDEIDIGLNEPIAIAFSGERVYVADPGLDKIISYPVEADGKLGAARDEIDTGLDDPRAIAVSGERAYVADSGLDKIISYPVEADGSSGAVAASGDATAKTYAVEAGGRLGAARDEIDTGLDDPRAIAFFGGRAYVAHAGLAKIISYPVEAGGRLGAGRDEITTGLPFPIAIAFSGGRAYVADLTLHKIISYAVDAEGRLDAGRDEITVRANAIAFSGGRAYVIGFNKIISYAVDAGGMLGATRDEITTGLNEPIAIAFSGERAYVADIKIISYPLFFPLVAPVAPIATAQSASEISISWSAVADATHYQLYRSAGGGSFDQIGNEIGETAYGDSGLDANTSYDYELEACNGNGCSARSAAFSATTALEAPTSGLSATAQSASEISLSWSAVADATHYKLYRSETGVGVFARIGDDIIGATDYVDDDGLDANTSYDYELEACNGSGCSARSAAFSATTALVAPTSGLSATAQSASEISLSWSAVADATHYQLYRSAGGGSLEQIGGEIGETAYGDSGLDANTLYEYELEACNDNGCSGRSAAVSATTALGMPTAGLSATAQSASEISLSWSAVADATHYQLYRSETGGGSLEQIGGEIGETAYGDSGLEANTSYEYRLEACNDNGCSARSAVFSATTALGMPTAGLSATAQSASEISLSWSAVADATHYQLYRSETGGGSLEQVGGEIGETAYGDSGLEANTSYEYRLEACNDNGCSARSAVFSATTALGMPTAGLSATAQSASEISLSWSAVVDATHYQLYRSAAGGGSLEQIGGDIGETAYGDSGLDANTLYEYELEACNDNGCSARSAAVSATTALGRPTAGLTATAQSASEISLSWSAVADATHYQLYRSAGGGSLEQIGGEIGETAYGDSGLDANTSYDYELEACNDNGCSARSAAVSATTALGRPTAGLSATAQSASEISLSWSAVADATHYQLYRSAAGGGSLEQIGGDIGETAYGDSGLDANTLYEYELEACNDNGCSGRSAAVSATTALGMPTAGLSATAQSASEISLSWSAVVDATHYQLYRSAGGGSLEQIGGEIGETAYGDSGLDANTSYDYELEACNDNGCSGRSAAFSATTALGMPTAGLSATTQSASEISLSWSAVADATHYQLYRSAGGGSLEQIGGEIGETAYGDSGLDANTLYEYELEACNDNGCSGRSAAVSATTALGMPTAGLSATAQSASEISLSWSAVADATHYQLYRSETGGGSLEQIGGEIGETAYGDSGLEANTSYEYRLEACNDNGCSARSAVFSATTALGMPTSGLSATTQSASEISLSWSAVADATHYQLYRSAGGGSFEQIGGEIVETAYGDSGLDANTSYDYELEACNGNGCSARSAAFSATTALGAPTSGLSATTQSASEISLSWSAVADATHYKLYRSAGGGSLEQIGGEIGETAYGDSGLDANTLYEYELEACNDNGCSARSAAVSATTALGRPTAGLTATAQSASEISLSWSAVADATHYQLYRSAGGGSLEQIGGEIGETAYGDSGLDANTSYDYELEACNDNGCSARSAAVSATTALGRPTAGLSATAQSASEISLSWSAVADATHYQLYRSAAGGGSLEQIGGEIGETAYGDSGLDANTLYEYELEACNDNGCSGRSAAVSATTALGRPTAGLSATAQSASEISLSWSAVADATHYQLYRSAAGGGSLEQIGGDIGETAYGDSGLDANTSYDYELEACNDNGCSGRSAAFSATTTPTMPLKPTAMSQSASEISLSWSAVAGAAHYNLYRATVSGGSYTQIGGDISATDYLDSGLSVKTAYYYRLEACNSGGCSERSLEVLVETCGSLGAGRDETGGLPQPRALAFSGGRAYVADVVLNKIISYPVGAGGELGAERDEITADLLSPSALAFSGGRAYVADAGLNKIISYAVGADGILGEGRDEITAGLQSPRAIAFSGGRAYVVGIAGRFGNEGKIISYPVGAGGELGAGRNEITTGLSGPAALAFSGGRAYVADIDIFGDEDKIISYPVGADGVLGAGRDEITTGLYLQSAIAFSGERAYVADAGLDKIISYPVEAGGELGAGRDEITGLRDPSALAFSGGRAYMVDTGASSSPVKIISYAVGAGGELGAGRDEITADLLSPFAIAFSSGRAYVADAGLNKIISYPVGADGRLGAERDEITTGLSNPFALAFSGGRAYVVDSFFRKIISYPVGAGGELGAGRDEITTGLSLPFGIAFSGGRAYVTDPILNKIISYPMGADGILGVGRDEITTGLDGSRALAISGGRAYVTDIEIHKIISYPVGAGGELGAGRDEITTGLASPRALAFSGGRAYVADAGLNKIISYAVGAGGELGAGCDEITGLRDPIALAFSGGRAYVADDGLDKIISYPLFSSVAFAVAPDAPRVFAQSDSEIEIAWNAVLGATHYKLYRSETSGGMYDQIGGDIFVTRYLNEDLSANTSYYYQLEACSGDECSGRSPKVSATTAPPLPPPLAPMTAMQSDSMISITWSAVAGATHYKLYRSTASGGPYTQVEEKITATSYVDSDLDADILYYYQLKVCNDKGCSGRSPEISTAITGPLGAGRDEITADLLNPHGIAFSGGRAYVVDDFLQKIISYAVGVGGSLSEARDEITAGLSSPSAIVFSGGRAYVVDTSLDKIISYAVGADGVLGEARDEITAGLSSPSAIAFSGDRAYVADTSLDKVISYAVGVGGSLSEAREEITVGLSFPHGIAFSGGRAYVVDPGLRKIISYAVGTDGILGAGRDEKAGFFNLRAIAFSGGRIYVMEAPHIISYPVGGDGSLGARRDEITTGLRDPRGIAFSGGRAYVTDREELHKIISYAVEADGSVGAGRDEITAGLSLSEGIAFSSGRAYVADARSNKIISYAVGVGGSLSAAREEITAGLAFPRALAFSGGRVYVANNFSTIESKIISYAVGVDGSLSEARDEITVGLSGPQGIAFSGGRAYVVDENSSKIISYAVGVGGRLGEARNEIRVGLRSPRDIAFSGGRAYVADIGLSKIISYPVGVGGVLGAARDEITNEITFRPGGGIAFSRGRAYVVEWAHNPGERSKKIISYAVGANGRLGAAREEITVGLLLPRGIAFSGGRAYVTDPAKIISYPLIQISPPIAPDAPRVVAQSGSEIEIAWNAVSGATHYKLYRATARDGSYTQIGGEISATRYLNDGLSDAFSVNTFYHYRLAACNSVGCSERSDGLVALTTLVAAPQSDSEISITWSAVAGATHYKLYRSRSDGSYTQIGGEITATGYLDSGLSVRTAYDYQLEVCNRVECSARSFEVSAITYGSLGAGRDEITAGLSFPNAIAFSSGRAYVADARSNKIISYAVGVGGSLSEARDEITAGLLGPRGIAFSGGRAYVADSDGFGGGFFIGESKIISYAVGVDGSLSEARDEITVGLSEPQGIAFSGGRAYVVGSSGFIGESKIISYAVGVDGSLSEARNEIRVGLRSPRDIAFSGGRAYVADSDGFGGFIGEFKIISYAVGVGGILGEARDEITAGLRSPQGIAFSGGRAYVVDDFLQKIISYAVGVDGVLGAARDEITAGLLFPQDISFSGGRAYVVDLDKFGNEDKIISYRLIQISPPIAPDAPRVVAQSGSEIEIAWNAVLGATHYKLYRATARNGSYTQIGGEISVTRYLNDGLSDAFSANTFYYYQLAACNSVGCSERSDGLVALTTLVAAPQSDSDISITWSAVAGATHYKLYRLMSDGSYTQIGDEITATGYLDGGLSVRIAYGYQLEVCNRVECSARSLEVSTITYGSLGAGRDEITAGLSSPSAIAFSGGRAYVADIFLNKIISYAVGAGGILGEARDEIAAGLNNPSAIAFSGGRAYVTDFGFDKIISYAVGAGGILGEARDEIAAGLNSPSAIAFSGGRAYVVNLDRFGNEDKIISYAVGAGGILGEARDEITTGLRHPTALAFSGGRAYVTDGGLDKIISYAVETDGSLGEARDEITAGLSSPNAIAFSGGRAYVTDLHLAKIISYAVEADGSLGAARDEITDGLDNPIALAFSGGRAYVMDSGLRKIISYPLLRISPPVAPDAPRVFAQSDSEIEIAWNAVLGATHYKLYRSETSGEMYDQIDDDISITRYLNEDLSANTSYYYQLEACNDSGCSGRSPEVLVETYGSLGAGRDDITTGLSNPYALAFSGGRAYVTDTNLGKIISYPVGAGGILGTPRDEITLFGPVALAFSGGRAYVVGGFRKIISYPVGADGRLGARRDEITTGLTNPAALAFSGGRAYVTDASLDKIISYPVGVGGELGMGRDEITTGLLDPYAFAFLGGRAYVVDDGFNKIISYLVGAGGELSAGRDEITTGLDFPIAIAFSGGRAYVADSNLDKIISYPVGADGILGAGRDEITTGLTNPAALAFSGDRAYVLDDGLDKIISYPLFSSVPFAVAPDAPRVFAQSDSEIEIAWNAVLGATHYKLYRSATSGGVFTLVEGDISITRYRDDNLSADTSYYYQLEACSGNDCSGRSPEVSGATYADGSLGAGRDEIVADLSDPAALAFSGGRAYVTDFGFDKIISYPVGAGGELGAGRDEITIGLSVPFAIAFSGGRAYVTDIAFDKIISYPVGAGGELGAGRDEITTGLLNPLALAFSGGRAYAADAVLNKIISYPVGAGGELGAGRDEITIGLSVPFALAFSGGRAYVADTRHDKIISYPVGAGGELGAGRDEITAGLNDPFAIAFSGGRAYVTDFGFDKIISYAVGAGGILGEARDEITTGLSYPQGIAFLGGRAYVADLDRFGNEDKIISYPLFSSVAFTVAPDAPRVFAQSDREIEIAWNAVLGATHYKLYRSETSGGTFAQVEGDISITRYRDDNLSADTSYYYQLEACNGDECSGSSPEVSAMTYAAGSLGAGRDEITTGLSGPYPIAFSGGRAYVADFDLSKIISYPVGASGELGAGRDEITTGLSRPTALAFSGGRVYVADDILEKIISYPVGAGGELGVGRDEITTGLDFPTALVFSGGRAYVADRDLAKIISYPVGSGGELGAGRDEITTGLSQPLALAFSGGRAYVADRVLRKIISYPVGSGGELGAGRDEITTGLSQPLALAFSGGRAYVSDRNMDNGKIIFYAVEAEGILDAERDEITTGLPYPLALAFSGGRAYVVDYTLNKIISYPIFSSVAFAVAPDAPRAFAQSDSEIEIAWNAVLEATHYKLYRSKTSGGMYTRIGGEISATRYLNDGLSTNTSYYYQLEACRGDECSGRSPDGSATTTLATPSALTAMAQSDSAISIAWSAVRGATYYKLYRSATGGGSYELIDDNITATDYLDNNLTANTSYYYQLEACNSHECSSRSLEISAATYGSLGAGRDEITTGLSSPQAIAFSGGRAYVASYDSSDNETKIISYPVEASGELGAGRDEITTGVYDPWAIAFSGGRAYVADIDSVKIISYAADANGSLGAARDEIPEGELDQPFAIAFSGGRAYVVDDGIRIISYPVGADGVLRRYERRYEIRAGLSRSFAIAFSGGRAYVTDSGHDKIISYPVGDDGELGVGRDEITAGLNSPFAIAFSGDRAYVTELDFSNKKGKIISYPVEANGILGAGRDETMTGFPRAIAFSGGRAYVADRFKIISYPQFSSVAFAVAPDAPRVVAQSESEIGIAWNAVLEATHYKLYRSETSGGMYDQIGGDISVTRYLNEDLSANTSYYYQLEACSGDECSGRSPEVSVTTDASGASGSRGSRGAASADDADDAAAKRQQDSDPIESSSKACNGDECSQRSPEVLTATRSAGEGVFHASGWVVGLDYQYGDGETGKTGEKGAFPLRSGQTVVFSTGQVTLGAVSIAADANADFFTPTRLGDQARAIRIERLLIALDSDGENDNGVVSLNAESASDALTAWNAARASDDEATTPINGRMRAIPSAATAATLLKRANNCGFSGAFAGRWTDADGNGGEHAMVLLAFNEGDIDGVSNPRGVFAGIDQITGRNSRNGKSLWIKLWNQGGGLQSVVTKYGAASGALSIDLSAFPVVATMTASNGVVMTITVESYGKIGYAVGGESGVLNRVRQEIPNADYRLAGFYSNDDRATPPGEQKPEIGIFAASIDGESEKLEPYIGRFLTDGAGVYSNIGHSNQDAAYTRQGTPADGTITIVADDGREIELRFTEQRDGVGYGAYEDTDANGDDGFDVFGGWCKL